MHNAVKNCWFYVLRPIFCTVESESKYKNMLLIMIEQIARLEFYFVAVLYCLKFLSIFHYVAKP